MKEDREREIKRRNEDGSANCLKEDEVEEWEGGTWVFFWV